ncbi:MULTISPECIES: Ppx/GppA family phosphatase [unclassified Streptomyces]|uniref:Ppx/GppA phosphatase family protein n=1 Tax=Streptomyces sp. NBC_01187 TaxID=2903766 RepID=UPI002DDC7329|nr:MULTISPECIES: Ppx/GppA family phosphatase [unclassified Streptomyces]WSA91886.1 Ppx/GppA family phosphatase [Streptomyces sp. NBC_01795]WSB76254.1 Ppx/GppA family phosphatase [Streptomyces sp. NBC_01775]WSS15471.1 Ppx/GppA family phosphatase [Streptomyces sp. NBC_01186]WSS44313.1 Ppx/GppA family phosphatase [Streptomyces sp. NBC_01187]
MGTRWAVVDVGSHSVRLEVADGDGAAPLPVHTAKWRLRLAHWVDKEGTLPREAVDMLADAVTEAQAEARRQGATELYAVATAVVRHAPNREQILETVRARSGVPLCVLDGRREAELTFLAARRWMGWRAGPLAMLDIGGGSLEVAFGRTGIPDFATSAPLGAARMTRDHFGGQDPPPAHALKSVRRETRHQLRDVGARIRWESPVTTAATSRTFQQLARLCGAAPGRKGPFVQRVLSREDLDAAVKRLSRRTAAQRAKLPGISAPRAAQSLAGAVVAHTAMDLLDLKAVTICPWALREGLLLHRLESGESSGWISL